MLSVLGHGVLLAVPYMTCQLGRATRRSARSDCNDSQHLHESAARRTNQQRISTGTSISVQRRLRVAACSHLGFESGRPTRSMAEIVS